MTLEHVSRLHQVMLCFLVKIYPTVKFMFAAAAAATTGTPCFFLPRKNISPRDFGLGGGLRSSCAQSRQWVKESDP